MFHSNLFAQLAARIRGGDLQARAQFRAELTRALEHIVWQTLQEGKATTSLAHRILVEARRLASPEDLAWKQHEQEFLGEVAQAVCGEVMAHLAGRYGFAAAESIGSGRHGATLVMR